MNIASIDIGTNTILLLIAKVDNNNIIPLLNEYRMPRIGSGINESGYISESKIDLLCKILNEYKVICTQFNCSLIFPFATQAMRMAKNQQMIVDKVYAETGLQINVISGEKEAELSFLGGIPDKNENESILIDIGGGSTEVIYGDKSLIKFKKSFKFGVVTLTEKYLTKIPYSKTEILNLTDFIKNNIHIPKEISYNTQIHAVSGTPTSLSCMQQNVKEYSDDIVENKLLKLKDINELIDILSTLTPNQAKEKFGAVLNGREDVILTGAIILQVFLKLVGADKVIVSTKGLRYGIIMNYLRLNERKENK